MFIFEIETKKERENIRAKLRDCIWKIRAMTASGVVKSNDERSSERWAIDSINELRKIFIFKVNEEVGCLFYAVMMRLMLILKSKIFEIEQEQFTTRLNQQDEEFINQLSQLLIMLNKHAKLQIEPTRISQVFLQLWLNQILARTAEEWELEQSYVDELFETADLLSNLVNRNISFTQT
jgi:hypothetical protein